MLYKQDLYPIIKSENLARNIYSLTIKCHHISNMSKPGQFVNVKVDGFTLRRPISICDSDKKNGLIKLVFIVKGEGTKKLSKLKEGDCVDIFGPLGHGFTLDNSKKAILVGGGLGVPPMVNLSSYYRNKAVAITGFRDYSLKILEDDFDKYKTKNIVCTDDGSFGTKGFVTQPLEEILSKDNNYNVYACGPIPMLRNIAKICNKFNVSCEVSMEERMGCGIGACLVCAIETIDKSGNIIVKHVCKDGPVFNSKEVFY